MLWVISAHQRANFNRRQRGTVLRQRAWQCMSGRSCVANQIGMPSHQLPPKTEQYISQKQVYRHPHHKYTEYIDQRDESKLLQPASVERTSLAMLTGL